MVAVCVEETPRNSAFEACRCPVEGNLLSGLAANDELATGEGGGQAEHERPQMILAPRSAARLERELN